MKKILLIISLLFSLASYSQVYQQFGAFSDNLDSLYTHVGKHHQYVVVLGRFNANDGLGGVYIYDTTLTTAEIPYLNFQVIGKDTGRWTLVQFLSQGGGTDTTIFANPNYAVLDIISDPPTSVLDAKYIVLTPGTGDWAGHDNNIATGTGTTPEWAFDTATVNQIASNAADNNLYIFTGTAWVALALNLHQNGENYGNIDIVAGNRQDRAFRFITNDSIRGGFDSVGNFRLNKYGQGDITGTPTFSLSVDANGNVIESVSASNLTWEQTLQTQGSTPFTTNNSVDFGGHSFAAYDLSSAQFSAPNGNDSGYLVVGSTESVLFQQVLNGASVVSVVALNDSTAISQLSAQTNVGSVNNEIISVYPDSIILNNTNGTDVTLILHKIDSSDADTDNIMWMDANDVVHRGRVATSGGTTDYQTATATEGQTAFVFSSVPASMDDYIIFVWGVAATPTTDYTTSGDTITFTTGLTDGSIVRFQRIK